MTVAARTDGKVGRSQHDGAQGYQLALDGLVHLLADQLLALGRVEHGRIDNVSRFVAAQHIGQCLHHIDASQQSNLDDLRLKVVDDGFHLLAYHRCRQVVELLNAQGVLHGDRGDNRCSHAPQLMDEPDVGLHTRDAGTVATCYGEYCLIHYGCKGTKKCGNCQAMFRL